MKRKNSPLTWILPLLASIAITWTFIYMMPIKDRGERVSIPFPNTNSPTSTKTPSYAQPDQNQQKIYRWIDAGGKTHYGDKPPKNVDIHTVDDANFSIVQFDKGRPQGTQQRTQQQTRPQMQAPQQKTTSTSKNSRCESAKAQIEAIDERMRRGYTARTGEALKEKRRQLIQQRNIYCH